MGQTIEEYKKIDGKGSFHIHQDGGTGKVYVDQVVPSPNAPMKKIDANGGNYLGDGQWYKWVWGDTKAPIVDGGLGPEGEPKLGVAAAEPAEGAAGPDLESDT
jgi:hypothetical protein